MNRKSKLGIAVIIILTIVMSAVLLQWAGKEKKVVQNDPLYFVDSKGSDNWEFRSIGLSGSALVAADIRPVSGNGAPDVYL